MIKNESQTLEFSAVHRLDKDTQGLIIFSKNSTAHAFFQDQFRARTVTKKYLAVCTGVLQNNHWINGFQTRDRGTPIRQKFFWDQEEAWQYEKPENIRTSTSILLPKIICPNLNQSLVEIQILTGRTHQIRLQTEAIGYPLHLDPIYQQESDFDGDTPGSVVENFKSLNHYSFLGKDLVLEMKETEFENIKKAIFGESEFCLLSNYLRFKLSNGTTLEAEYFDLNAWPDSAPNNPL